MTTPREQFEYELWHGLQRYQLSTYRQTVIGTMVLGLVDTYVQEELAVRGEEAVKRRDRHGKIHYFESDSDPRSICNRISRRNASGYITTDPNRATCGHCRSYIARNLTDRQALATLGGSRLMHKRELMIFRIEGDGDPAHEHTLELPLGTYQLDVKIHYSAPLPGDQFYGGMNSYTITLANPEEVGDDTPRAGTASQAD